MPKKKDIVIPIILDGENPWEYYPGSGRDFLREFFTKIQEDPSLETITFSQAAEMESGKLNYLEPGSWIGGNFNIWIGDKEDIRAWKLLQTTRDAVADLIKNSSDPRAKEIRELLFTAQGSDWFWWFGKEHYTSEIDIFDNLFRQNLQKIFELSGNQIPGGLLKPVSERLQKKG
jgi:alpha-amylase/alpha-mannosidase (GH57 family)